MPTRRTNTRPPHRSVRTGLAGKEGLVVTSSRATAAVAPEFSLAPTSLRFDLRRARLSDLAELASRDLNAPFQTLCSNPQRSGSITARRARVRKPTKNYATRASPRDSASSTRPPALDRSTLWNDRRERDGVLPGRARSHPTTLRSRCGSRSAAGVATIRDGRPPTIGQSLGRSTVLCRRRTRSTSK